MKQEFKDENAHNGLICDDYDNIPPTNTKLLEHSLYSMDWAKVPISLSNLILKIAL